MKAKNIELNYTNLGPWRKVFVVCLCLLILIQVLAMAALSYVSQKKTGLSQNELIVSFSWLALHIFLNVWLIEATIKRNLLHLKILAWVQIIPLGNIVFSFITFLIYGTSKPENEEAVKARKEWKEANSRKTYAVEYNNAIFSKQAIKRIRDRGLRYDLFDEKKNFITNLGGKVELTGFMKSKVNINLGKRNISFKEKGDFCRWVFVKCKRLCLENENRLLDIYR